MMIDLRDLPPPAKEALVVYVEIREEDVHFFDSALKAFNNIVNPRRDMRLHQGKIYYRNYVAPDFFNEFQELLNTLKNYVPIGGLLIEP